MSSGIIVPVSNSKGAGLAFKHLYETKKYSDMTIMCRGQEFEAHRAVLCPQSVVLAKMMDKQFKEAKTCVVDLSEDEPFIISKMLQFLYTSDYNDNRTVDADYAPIPSGAGNSSKDETNVKASALTVPSSGIENAYSSSLSEFTSPTAAGYMYEPLVINAKVYIIGDVYDISELKKLARKKYEAALTKDWNTPSFSESLGELYENRQYSDRSIKEVALTAATLHRQELLDHGEFASLLEQNGKIGLDILKHGTVHRIPASASNGYKCQWCMDHGSGSGVRQFICPTCGQDGDIIVPA